jgi:ketosteroid isomerase-like protein
MVLKPEIKRLSQTVFKKEMTNMNTNTKTTTENFAQTFKKVFLGEDLEGFMKIVDKDAVWTFMATGEKFCGAEQIRKAGAKAMAGRIHTKDLHMEFTNVICSEDQVCVEYLHRGLAPKQGTITGTPPEGTEIAMPICITMHIKDGKLDRMNEYLDMGTLSGTTKHLFS